MSNIANVQSSTKYLLRQARKTGTTHSEIRPMAAIQEACSTETVSFHNLLHNYDRNYLAELQKGGTRSQALRLIKHKLQHLQSDFEPGDSNTGLLIFSELPAIFHLFNQISAKKSSICSTSHCSHPAHEDSGLFAPVKHKESLPGQGFGEGAHVRWGFLVQKFVNLVLLKVSSGKLFGYDEHGRSPSCEAQGV